MTEINAHKKEIELLKANSTSQNQVIEAQKTFIGQLNK